MVSKANYAVQDLCWSRGYDHRSRTFLRMHQHRSEASYESPARIGAEAGVRDKRNFTDWYAPDVGLVTPLVSTDGQEGCQMARIGMLRFAKSVTTRLLLPERPTNKFPLSSLRLP